MPRPLTRAAAQQNRAFLKILRKTGNVRLACREVGLAYGTMQHRRRVHRSFAARWDAAIVFAQVRLGKGGGKCPLPSAGIPSACGRRSLEAGSAQPSPPEGGEGVKLGPRLRGDDERRRRVPDLVRDDGKGPSTAPSPKPSPSEGRGLFRTVGGEPVLVRLKNGTLQVRRAQAGKLTREAEQAFLAAVSATCNLSLAAAAVGAAFNAFNRRRKTNPAFARELRLALKEGYETLELALLEGLEAYSHEHDDWRSNEPPAIPPMSVSQALQLMYLHQKQARLLAEPDYLKRRRGEPREAHRARLMAMSAESDRIAREEFDVVEAERRERGERTPLVAAEERMALRDAPASFEDAWRMGLPDLAQVTGWSRADPAKAVYNPDVALFGGWRIEEMEGRLDSRFDLRSSSTPRE